MDDREIARAFFIKHSDARFVTIKRQETYEERDIGTRHGGLGVHQPRLTYMPHRIEVWITLANQRTIIEFGDSDEDLFAIAERELVAQ